MPVLHAWLHRDARPLIVSVQQDGGFGKHVAPVMRAVHQDIAWNGAERLWTFPYLAASVYALDYAAKMLGLQLKLDADLEKVRSAVLSENEKEEGVRKVCQTYIDDPKLAIAAFKTQENPPPWRHQAIAWHWAMRVKALYLQHKMGLGKTREGADIIRGKWEQGLVRAPEQFYDQEVPSSVDSGKILPAQWCIRGGVLVVCPRAVMVEWIEQLWRWQGIVALPIVGRSAQHKRERAGMAEAVHICSYDSLEIVERNWYDGIIGDELHFIANEDSNRAKRMLALRDKARWVVGLSGTAQRNGLESLWAQYYWLDGGRTLGPTYDAFKKMFLTKENRPGDVTADDAVARAISRITWPLTMLQAFPDKPVKIHKTLRVPMTEEQAGYYSKIRQQQEADIIGGKVTLFEALTRIQKLIQVTQGFVFDDKKVVQQFSSAKLKTLEELLTNKGDLSDKRVLVWCSFIPELAMIQGVLTRHKIKYLTLQGGLSDSQREQIKDAWNNDASYKVLIGMISMGIGLNLHAPKCVDEKGKPARCSTTVFYGLSQDPTVIEQAMDRVYRGDQVESCLYVYLLSEDLDGGGGNKKPVVPIDVKIYERFMAKIEHAKEVNANSIEYVRSLLAS